MADLLNRISVDPAICHGRPTLRGSRYPVEMVLELLSAGMTGDEVLADYEDLEREDIRAALAYAARLVKAQGRDRSGGNAVQDEEAARRLQEGDELYERYGKPLEAEHWGEFVAIFPDGRTLIGPTAGEVMRQAVQTFGPGSYVFKVGPRAVGRL